MIITVKPFKGREAISLNGSQEGAINGFCKQHRIFFQ